METKPIVVIPTCRDVNFLGNWEKQLEPAAKVIVIEDRPKCKLKIPDIGIPIDTYSWKEINQDIKENSWIFSRGSDAIRSYGFLKAYQEKATHILTLDDDCHPVLGQDWINSHIKILDKKHLSNRWVNSLSDVCPLARGIPKSAMNNNMISLGLWLGIPDFDGETQLNHSEFRTSSDLLNRINVPRGSYFPMSAMNLAFKREIIPLMYFPLMGEATAVSALNEYHRFGDIWCGLIAKKILDHFNYGVSMKGPLVFHQRKSDPVKNNAIETKAKQTNETLWQIIDEIELNSSSLKNCYAEVAFALQASFSESYWKKLSDAMLLWLQLLNKNGSDV